MKIHFVTSNTRKLEEYERRLKDLGVCLEQIDEEVDEGRTFDILEIAKKKLNKAKLKYPGRKLIVDDRGFEISTLKGFPGPFVKPILNTIGVEGLLNLMRGKENREAVFLSVLAYFDGEKDHFFIDKEVGFLTEEAKGDNLRGWTDLLFVYGYSSYPCRSLAELKDHEWEAYLNEIEKNDFISKFRKFIKNPNSE